MAAIMNLSLGSTDTIVIDANRLDQLNISEIAQKVIAIPVKISNFKSIGIEKIFLVDENLFILQRYLDQGTRIIISHVYRFDISGNYGGELVAIDPVSKNPIEIIDIQYDDTNKCIIISYSDGYRVFDHNGKLLTYCNGIQSQYKFLFKGHFWSVDHSFANGYADYSLVYSDLNGQNKDTIRRLKIKSIGFNTFPDFSIHNNELYFSFGVDNSIYKVNKLLLLPAYNFVFKNRPFQSTDVFGAPHQLVFSHFIKFGYRIGFVPYDFLFDTNSRKSYNIRYQIDHNEIISGIKDDIYFTGYFDIKPTNIEDYIYFFKKSENLIGSKISETEKKYPTIFLVKLK